MDAGTSARIYDLFVLFFFSFLCLSGYGWADGGLEEWAYPKESDIILPLALLFDSSSLWPYTNDRMSLD